MSYFNRIRMAAFEEAQGGVCGLCGERFVPPNREHEVRWGLRRSFDHVEPKGAGGPDRGNLLLAHQGCNNKKGGRPPTGCELIWLQLVNARLGVKSGPMNV